LTFLEIDLLGIYVAPISLLIIAAWFVTIALPDRGPLRLAGLRVAFGGVRCRWERNMDPRRACSNPRNDARLTAATWPLGARARIDACPAISTRIWISLC
jgi:hypothetical protein